MANKRKRRSFRKRRKLRVKRIRIEKEENLDAHFSTNIVDLNFDCLEHVFKHLHFRDLINLGDTNKHLGAAAETVFARKMQRIFIEVCPSSLISSGADVATYDDGLCIYSPRLAIRAIRLFGHRISVIHLSYFESDFLREKFFVYVNKYCHKTLNVLLIVGDYFSKLLIVAKHPFENVTEFISRRGVIGPELEHFARLFPRLRHLKLVTNRIVQPKYICQKFPNLHAFNFDYSGPLYYRSPFLVKLNLERINFKEFISLNPQMQSFALSGYLYPNIWKIVNAKLKNLKSISICYSPDHFVGYERSPIRFDNVETVQVFSKGSTHQLSRVKPIDVLSFKRLTNMIVQCHGDQLEKWLDFVLAHPTIEALKIDLLETMNSYRKCLDSLDDKLKTVKQNTKSITLLMNFFEYAADEDLKFQLVGLKEFLEAAKWFDKFSVVFAGHVLNQIGDFMENLMENIHCGVMKNYQIKSYVLMKNPYVEFVRCD